MTKVTRAVEMSRWAFKVWYHFLFGLAVIGSYLTANQIGLLHNNHTVIDTEYAMENCETYYKKKEKK